MADLVERAGWYLPKSDTYFAQFYPGPAPKRNGFQREHLHEAFKFVKRWDAAFDIGAHVGFWTWDMAQRFKRVYAFEAAPDTYDCLVKNVAECGNVTTAQFAISSESGKAILNEDPSRPPGNTGSRWITAINPEQAVKLGVSGAEGVPMIPLDSINLHACDFIKIDVEGHEYHVLQGAKETIAKFHPVIIMECDKKFTHRYGLPHGAAEELLRIGGYRCVAHMRPDKVFVP
jgi:FkbM family methyltransferase